MTTKDRDRAVSNARMVISRRKIFDPLTVGLARSVLDYEATLSELTKAAADVIEIVRDTA